MKIGFLSRLQIKNYCTPFRGIQVYCFFLISFTFYYLAHWPIVAYDTDLWYHLNAGRNILAHQSLPTTSFFSFLSPPREWVDYYWLFQVIVFKVYSWGGYHGLILFRAVLFGGTLLLVFAYLLKNRVKNNSAIFPALVFGLILLLLLPRNFMLRPHCFSYFFIPAFLYILEFQPRKVILLPFLAVLWSNLHGVEYPIMLLILLAYILEYFLIRRRRGEKEQKEDLRYLLPLVLSLGAVYLTPNGSNLIGVPFISTDLASQYIKELAGIPINDFLSFQIPRSLSHPRTIYSLLVAFSVVSAVKSFWDLRFRASHVFLLLGAFFLLSRGGRFVYEFALLSLPFLRNFPWPYSFIRLQNRKLLLVRLAAICVLLLPVLWLRDFFKHPPKFPFSAQDLNQGNIAFLDRIAAGGSIVNHPNRGGYLQWRLYPKYKILMDMQVPFLFSDQDYFIAQNVFTDEAVLRKVVSEYHPSFLTVPIVTERFKELIKAFPEYVVVFFDNSEVLYMNQKHFPKIADQYAIKEIDPFELASKKVDLAIRKRNKELLLADLRKMLEIYPECLLKNQIVAMVLNKDKEYWKALPHTETMIRNFPESPSGYRLKGDALAGLKDYDRALSSYHMALDRIGEEGRKGLYKQLGYVYNEQRKFAEAYGALRQATDIFAAETTYRDLFDLGSTALAAGRIKEAYDLFTFAGKKVPSEDAQWIENVREKLSMIKMVPGA